MKSKDSQFRISSREVGRVLLASLPGAIFITFGVALFWVFGLAATTPEMFYGQNVLGGEVGPGVGPWFLGLLIHLGATALASLLYIPAFRLACRSGVYAGAALGALHWALYGIALGIVFKDGPHYFGLGFGGSVAVLLPFLYIAFGSWIGAVDEANFPYVSSETDEDSFIDGVAGATEHRRAQG